MEFSLDEAVVLAAIDDSAAAGPVLRVARRLGEVLGIGVEALHVNENGDGRTAAAVAEAEGVPLRVVRGDAFECIAAEAADARVSALLIGARGVPTGKEPAGHVALDLVTHVDKPVVVVPPAAVVAPSGRLPRVLVPLEGNGADTCVLLRELLELVRAVERPDIIAVHVFEPESLPPFGDQPLHETEAWSREFLERCSPVPPDDVQLELRVGPVEHMVAEVATEVGADAVVVGWRRDLSEGHARVVRSLLAHSRVPVALLPTGEVRLVSSGQTRESRPASG